MLILNFCIYCAEDQIAVWGRKLGCRLHFELYLYYILLQLSVYLASIPGTSSPAHVWFSTECAGSVPRAACRLSGLEEFK